MVAEQTRYPHCFTRVCAKICSRSGGRLFVVALRAFACTPGVDFMTSMDPKTAARRVEVERLLGKSRNIPIEKLKERFTI